MTHKNVLEQFRIMFPCFDGQIIEWFPNGKNSIRVRNKMKQDFIFTYNKDRDWSLKTLDNFLKEMKK